MCADGNTRAALPRFFLRVGITGHECGCSRSGGRIHAAPLARGGLRERPRKGWTKCCTFCTHGKGAQKSPLNTYGTTFYRVTLTAVTLTRRRPESHTHVLLLSWNYSKKST